MNCRALHVAKWTQKVHQPPTPTASNELKAIAEFLFFDWLWSACSRQQNSVFSVMVTRTLHDLVVPHAQRISSFEASCMVNLSERITEGAQQFGVQYVCHTEAERTFVCHRTIVFA